jgi:4-hydroxybenzoate polyprenyltransferase
MNPYVAIARPDHWFKNIFVLPGIGLAGILTETSLASIAFPAFLGLVSVCSIASANYAINEWLDADFDKHHPRKKNRPSVVAKLDVRVIGFEYALLTLLGLSLAWWVSVPYFVMTAIFSLMGLIYNVEPIRSKDRVYLDVLSESINNPIRLCLGWFIVTSAYLPPSSLILGYWMSGAFLMAVKRFAELRYIADPEIAGLYRRSFRHYTEESLLVSTFFYSSCAAFFLGVFLVKHRIELLLSLPFLALLFAWYLLIGLRPDSPVQQPEHLYRETRFGAYVVFVALWITLLFVLDIPALNAMLHNAFTTAR